MSRFLKLINDCSLLLGDDAHDYHAIQTAVGIYRYYVVEEDAAPFSSSPGSTEAWEQAVHVGLSWKGFLRAMRLIATVRGDSFNDMVKAMCWGHPLADFSTQQHPVPIIPGAEIEDDFRRIFVAYAAAAGPDGIPLRLRPLHRALLRRVSLLKTPSKRHQGNRGTVTMRQSLSPSAGYAWKCRGGMTKEAFRYFSHWTGIVDSHTSDTNVDAMFDLSIRGNTTAASYDHDRDTAADRGSNAIVKAASGLASETVTMDFRHIGHICARMAKTRMTSLHLIQELAWFDGTEALRRHDKQMVTHGWGCVGTTKDNFISGAPKTLHLSPLRKHGLSPATHAVILEIEKMSDLEITNHLHEVFLFAAKFGSERSVGISSPVVTYYRFIATLNEFGMTKESDGFGEADAAAIFWVRIASDIRKNGRAFKSSYSNPEALDKTVLHNGGEGDMRGLNWGGFQVAMAKICQHNQVTVIDGMRKAFISIEKGT